MPGFEHGVSRALLESLSSLIVGLISRIICEISGWKSIAMILYLVLCWTSREIVEKMKCWSTSYLVGHLLAHLVILYMTPDHVSIIVTLAGLAILFGRLTRMSFKHYCRLHF